MMIEEHTQRIKLEIHGMKLKMTVFNEHGDDFRDEQQEPIYILSDFDVVLQVLEE